VRCRVASTLNRVLSVLVRFGPTLGESKLETYDFDLKLYECGSKTYVLGLKSCEYESESYELELKSYECESESYEFELKPYDCGVKTYVLKLDSSSKDLGKSNEAIELHGFRPFSVIIHIPI
jgi:hypothetical protein